MYPIELLPKVGRKAPDITEGSEFIRSLEVNPRSLFYENSKYTMDVLDLVLIPQGTIEIYSLSLFLEKEFDISWLKCYPPKDKKKYCSNWDNKTELDPASIEYEEHAAYPLYFFCSKIIRKGYQTETELGVVDIGYRYEPTMCNFFHYQLSITDSKTQIEIPRKKGTNRELAAGKIAEDVLYLSINHSK